MAVVCYETLALTVIDQWLTYKSRYSTLPGIQVCIRRCGNIVWSKAYGYADVAGNKALTIQHLFHIASHSKSFTACLILQLVQDGLLDLQQSVAQHLPVLNAHPDPRFKEITLRDLLSNRCGLFRDGPESEFWSFQKDFPDRQQLIDEILSMPLVYEPATKSKYSNFGFGLLGLVIEKITGQTYAQALSERIFQKLHLNHIYSDYTSDIQPFFAHGYSRTLERGQRLHFKHEPTYALAPATGLCANAETTSLFFYELLQGNKLLSSTMRKELLSLKWPIPNPFAKEHYGLGLEFDTHDRIDWVGHSGGYPGFVTLTAHWLGSDYTISVLCNSNDAPVMNFWISIPLLIDKLKATFTETELEKVIIAGPFLTVWKSYLFIVGREKTLSLSVDKTLLTQDALTFKADTTGRYYCDQENGFGNLGEALTFTKDAQGHIVTANWGGETLYQEEDFKASMRNATQL